MFNDVLFIIDNSYRWANKILTAALLQIYIFPFFRILILARWMVNSLMLPLPALWQETSGLSVPGVKTKQELYRFSVTSNKKLLCRESNLSLISVFVNENKQSRLPICEASIFDQTDLTPSFSSIRTKSPGIHVK